MYDELLPGLYRIEVPLPNNPLRAVYAYLIEGPKRNLLVDNGFNHPESYAALSSALEKLNVDLAKTDFFLTHLHSDHNGLTSSLACSPESKVMCSKEDAWRINAGITGGAYWKDMFDGLVCNGFPRGELGDLYLHHPGRIYAPPAPLKFTFVQDGDTLNYDSYSFTVIEVPGHSPGQVILYEPVSKILISGDHILGRISPNITLWPGVKDPLGDYLKSLDKIDKLIIVRTFPAHRDIITDTHGRIAELKKHHADRLGEILTVLSSHGALNAYQIASHLTWSLRGITWNEFKVQHQCFATGETLAHLRHLQISGFLQLDQGNCWRITDDCQAADSSEQSRAADAVSIT